MIQSVPATRSFFFARRLLLLAVTACAGLQAQPLVAANAQHAPSAPCPALPRPQDELWVVCTRGLGCGNAAELASHLQYQRRDERGVWVNSSREEFLAHDDPDTITTVWLHGNRISAGEARDWVGPTVYRSLVRQAPSERPMRFVIWSWPSERIDAGPLKDVREKAYRCDREAYFLARFLDELSPDLQISLIGYSFGTRIVDGSLNLLGGGAVNQYCLTSRVHSQRLPMRAVLLAAACDNDWLLPGRHFGHALGQTEHLLNIYNSCDPVLKRYHLLYHRRSCAEALGYTGVVGWNMLGYERTKISQYDACCIVGKQHNWVPYFESRTLVGQMVPSVFFLPPPGAKVTPAPTPAAAWKAKAIESAKARTSAGKSLADSTISKR